MITLVCWIISLATWYEAVSLYSVVAILFAIVVGVSVPTVWDFVKKTVQIVVLLFHAGIFVLLIFGFIRAVPGVDFITSVAFLCVSLCALLNFTDVGHKLISCRAARWALAALVVAVLVSGAVDALRLHRSSSELSAASDSARAALADALATLEASRAVLDQALVLRSASVVAYEEAQATLVALLDDLRQLRDEHAAALGRMLSELACRAALVGRTRGLADARHEQEGSLARSNAQEEETREAAAQKICEAERHAGRRVVAQAMDGEAARAEAAQAHEREKLGAQRQGVRQRVVTLRAEKDMVKGATQTLLGRFKGLVEGLLF
eukprot:m51a1_g773 hypothetical protein (323) ;mRNA; r:583022-584120